MQVSWGIFAGPILTHRQTEKTYTGGRHGVRRERNEAPATRSASYQPGNRGSPHGSHVGRKTWTCRYRSPLDQKLRQVRIGTWPAVSLHVAVVAWERLRDLRDSGRNPAVEARADRVGTRRSIAEVAAASAPQYTPAQSASSMISSLRKRPYASVQNEPRWRATSCLAFRLQGFTKYKYASAVVPVVWTATGVE
ncbi:Arm DNA-binding domain-containing protein [Accumulibacter sp.]|uniref:Arm DNA-binding domain-containing protein n=1 Tax=Accumulibacter sp. TaxID=2053492 RepID=UPI003418685A